MPRFSLPLLRKRSKLPPAWEAHRRRQRRFTAAEFRLTLLGGMFAGLLTYHAAGLFVPTAVAAPEVAPARIDPWTESRASKAILEAQERAPPNYFEQEVSGRSTALAPAVAVAVIDGDTFRYGGERIRIADIDAPETHPPRCAYEAELGERATRRLAGLIGDGRIALRPAGGRDTDRYGRKLRIVERNGRSVGDILVEEGLARPWEGRRRPWCA